MFYEYGGKIYAPRSEDGKLVYDMMAVQAGEDGAPHIVNEGGSVNMLPPGSLPMTHREVLARIPCTAAKPKRSKKAVKTDEVS